jgi:D-3-phosphoglycerate dehydrogenase / 2-oxoglutarate reductase
MNDVLVTENIVGAEMEAMRRTFSVSFEPEIWKSQDRLLAAVAKHRAIIVRNQTTVSRQVIAAGKGLEVIGRAGVGLDNVDVNAASEAGVVVAYTPEQNAISVAELTLGMMLALARRIPAGDASTKAGRWERQGFTGTELFGKTLGLVGLGRIGFLVAMRARSFGMRIIAHDSFLSPDSVLVAECGARLVSLDELLAQADVISVHVPKTAQTERMFDAAKFGRMKPGALFVNTSRGEVVDENALLAALRKGLAGAALDVRATEPPTAGELETLPNVILTPHIAAFTAEGQGRVVASICRDVAAVLRGQPARNYVNFPTPAASRLTAAPAASSPTPRAAT